MMKVTSPQRFYADPAVSLGISLIIAASALPMSACYFSESNTSLFNVPLSIQIG